MILMKVPELSRTMKPETRGQYWNFCSEENPCEDGAGDCDK